MTFSLSAPKPESDIVAEPGGLRPNGMIGPSRPCALGGSGGRDFMMSESSPTSDASLVFSPQLAHPSGLSAMIHLPVVPGMGTKTKGGSFGCCGAADREDDAASPKRALCNMSKK